LHRIALPMVSEWVDITFVLDKDSLARLRPINVVQRSRGAP
jgi:hypothetical protein